MAANSCFCCHVSLIFVVKIPLVFSLRFGWYGFNPGSTLTMKSGSDGALAAQVAMNTTLAAATGGITVFLLRDWAAVRHVETRNWYTE